MILLQQKTTYLLSPSKTYIIFKVDTVIRRKCFNLMFTLYNTLYGIKVAVFVWSARITERDQTWSSRVTISI